MPDITPTLSCIICGGPTDQDFSVYVIGNDFQVRMPKPTDEKAGRDMLPVCQHHRTALIQGGVFKINDNKEDTLSTNPTTPTEPDDFDSMFDHDHSFDVQIAKLEGQPYTEIHSPLGGTLLLETCNHVECDLANSDNIPEFLRDICCGKDDCPHYYVHLCLEHTAAEINPKEIIVDHEDWNGFIVLDNCPGFLVVGIGGSGMVSPIELFSPTEDGDPDHAHFDMLKPEADKIWPEVEAKLRSYATLISCSFSDCPNCGRDTRVVGTPGETTMMCFDCEEDPEWMNRCPMCEKVHTTSYCPEDLCLVLNHPDQQPLFEDNNKKEGTTMPNDESYTEAQCIACNKVDMIRVSTGLCISCTVGMADAAEPDQIKGDAITTTKEDNMSTPTFSYLTTEEVNALIPVIDCDKLITIVNDHMGTSFKLGQGRISPNVEVTLDNPGQFYIGSDYWGTLRRNLNPDQIVMRFNRAITSGGDYFEHPMSEFTKTIETREEVKMDTETKTEKKVLAPTPKQMWYLRAFYARWEDALSEEQVEKIRMTLLKANREEVGSRIAGMKTWESAQTAQPKTLPPANHPNEEAMYFLRNFYNRHEATLSDDRKARIANALLKNNKQECRGLVIRIKEAEITS